MVRKKGMDPEFREFIGKNALAIDLINIAPLDDLHQPKGIIKQAQDLAATAFGADHTFFSVQGTSGVIMTMVMSVCGPGDKILVPRNVHKSIMSGIIFSGATPIFIHQAFLFSFLGRLLRKKTSDIQERIKKWAFLFKVPRIMR